MRTPAETIALAVSGILAAVGLAVAIVMIRKLMNRKTWYRHLIDGYLRDYDEAIINTKTPPNLQIYKESITVESFKELLNLAVTTGDPIIYYENEDGAFFYCPKGEIIYGLVILKTIERPEEVLTIREAEAIEETASDI